MRIVSTAAVAITTVSAVVALLSLDIIGDGATITVTMSVTMSVTSMSVTSMTIAGSVVDLLSFGVSDFDFIGNGATVAVAVSVTMSVTMTISMVSTMVSVAVVTASGHLLIGHLSHFGLFGHSRSNKNSQNNQEFHLCSRSVDRIVSVEKLVPMYSALI